MEFFREIGGAERDELWIRQEVTVEALPRFCEEIEKVLEAEGDEGRIWCLWGGFRVRREPIRGGVRFTLPECPNAFAWTVTTGLPPHTDGIVIHATINRREHDPDFIESIDMFLDAWQEGLRRAARSDASER